MPLFAAKSRTTHLGPFGEVIRATSSISPAIPIRWSTKYTDLDTDLVYYGHRYYNPSTGRWLSRDPIGEKGGLNLYGFVGNSAINRIDLLGLTIPGMGPGAYDYPPYNCWRCKCLSVKITFDPGGDKFAWGWKAPSSDAASQGKTARYGSDMTVVWTVKGDPRGCTYSQDESDPTNFFDSRRANPQTTKSHERWTVLPLGKGQTIAKESFGTDSFTYVDPIGQSFGPGDQGEWTITMAFKAVVKCASTDGSSVSQTVNLGDADVITYPAP